MTPRVPTSFIVLGCAFVTACGGGGDSGGGGGGANVGRFWAATGDAEYVALVDSANDTIENIPANDQVEHVAVGAGAVWATTVSETVLRLDPKTHAIVATISGFDAIRSIVANDTSVWVADNGNGNTVPPRVRRIDPATNTIVGSFEAHEVNDEYHELRATSSGVYLQIDNGFSVVRIDPKADAVLESVDLGKGGGYGGGELAIAGEDVWAADQYSNFLHHLSASPLAKVHEYTLDQRFDGDMTVGDGKVFIEDTDAHSVGVFDASDGSLEHEIQAGESIKHLSYRNGILVVALSYTGNGEVLLFEPGGKKLKTLHAVYAEELAFE